MSSDTKVRKNECPAEQKALGKNNDLELLESKFM